MKSDFQQTASWKFNGKTHRMIFSEGKKGQTWIRVETTTTVFDMPLKKMQRLIKEAKRLENKVNKPNKK